MAPLPLWTAPLNVSHKDPSFPETDFAVSVRKVGYGDERGKRQPSVARQPQLDRQWHFAVGYKQPTPFHTPAPENLVITMDEAKDKGTLELFLNSGKTRKHCPNRRTIKKLPHCLQLETEAFSCGSVAVLP